MSECEECGCEERVTTDRHGATLCAWCRCDLRGRPYGTCPYCRGAKAHDGTCACKPGRKS